MSAKPQFVRDRGVVTVLADGVAASEGGLAAIGASVSLDDFGTGHSSLAQLKRLPIRQLKIDMGFILDIGADKTSEAIIEATIGLARGLGLETVAEGIELPHQAEFLRAAGCDVAQGYLFGRPVPASEFMERFGPKEAR